MKNEKLLNRVDELILLGKAIHSASKPDETTSKSADLSKLIGFRAICLSFIRQYYGEKHPYFTEFNLRIVGHSAIESEHGISILNSIRKEIENDWLISVKQQVASEVFCDLLEVAKSYLNDKYKDAAAIIIGSVLEGHLRLLCSQNSIDIKAIKETKDNAKKAELMNVELLKANIYGVLEQINVATWLDLRNRAARGQSYEYSSEQIDLMYQGVLYFVTKFR